MPTCIGMMTWMWPCPSAVVIHSRIKKGRERKGHRYKPILSPSTRSRDRGIKLRAYEAAGVRSYWIANPRARTLEERVLGEDGHGEPTVYGIGDTLRPSLFPGLAIEIASLWS